MDHLKKSSPLPVVAGFGIKNATQVKEVCSFSDGVVVENGALVGARAYVEPETLVKAGYIWAGRPAVEFRPVKPEEHEFFQRGKEVYVGYTDTYLAEQAA